MVLRGDDPMDHRNWEFSEKWLHDFPYVILEQICLDCTAVVRDADSDRILADDEVYTISNRWRLERGDPPLTRPEQRV
jgi:hypothetical protein